MTKLFYITISKNIKQLLILLLCIPYRTNCNSFFELAENNTSLATSTITSLDYSESSTITSFSSTEPTIIENNVEYRGLISDIVATGITINKRGKFDYFLSIK